MKMSSKLAEALARAKQTDEYWVEKAKIDFSIQLERSRRTGKFSYADIARKLGTSAAYITKVFRGDSNLTIDSMVRLARSTGGELNIKISSNVLAEAPIYHPRFSTGQRWVAPSVSTVLNEPAANQDWRFDREQVRLAA